MFSLLYHCTLKSVPHRCMHVSWGGGGGGGLEAGGGCNWTKTFAHNNISSPKSSFISGCWQYFLQGTETELVSRKLLTGDKELL